MDIEDTTKSSQEIVPDQETILALETYKSAPRDRTFLVLANNIYRQTFPDDSDVKEYLSKCDVNFETMFRGRQILGKINEKKHRTKTYYHYNPLLPISKFPELKRIIQNQMDGTDPKFEQIKDTRSDNMDTDFLLEAMAFSDDKDLHNQLVDYFIKPLDKESKNYRIYLRERKVIISDLKRALFDHSDRPAINEFAKKSLISIYKSLDPSSNYMESLESDQRFGKSMKKDMQEIRGELAMEFLEMGRERIREEGDSDFKRQTLVLVDEDLLQFTIDYFKEGNIEEKRRLFLDNIDKVSPQSAACFQTLLNYFYDQKNPAYPDFKQYIDTQESEPLKSAFKKLIEVEINKLNKINEVTPFPDQTSDKLDEFTDLEHYLFLLPLNNEDDLNYVTNLLSRDDNNFVIKELISSLILRKHELWFENIEYDSDIDTHKSLSKVLIPLLDAAQLTYSKGFKTLSEKIHKNTNRIIMPTGPLLFDSLSAKEIERVEAFIANYELYKNNPELGSKENLEEYRNLRYTPDEARLWLTYQYWKSRNNS